MIEPKYLENLYNFQINNDSKKEKQIKKEYFNKYKKSKIIEKLPTFRNKSINSIMKSPRDGELQPLNLKQRYIDKKSSNMDEITRRQRYLQSSQSYRKLEKLDKRSGSVLDFVSGPTKTKLSEMANPEILT